MRRLRDITTGDLPCQPPPSAARFPTTDWSRVVRAGDPAGPEARDALEGLCRDYWYPLYAFVRRRGLTPDDAGDLVQGFLADLIERGDLSIADPDRGRFRTFLRAACVNFLAHRREHDRGAEVTLGAEHPWGESEKAGKRDGESGTGPLLEKSPDLAISDLSHFLSPGWF